MTLRWLLCIYQLLPDNFSWSAGQSPLKSVSFVHASTPPSNKTDCPNQAFNSSGRSPCGDDAAQEKICTFLNFHSAQHHKSHSKSLKRVLNALKIESTQHVGALGRRAISHICKGSQLSQTALFSTMWKAALPKNMSCKTHQRLDIKADSCATGMPQRIWFWSR